MSKTRTRKITVTIASGATTSGAVFIGELEICAIEFPAAFTGSTIALENAAINDQSGENDKPTTFFAMLDASGAAISVTVQTSKHVVLSTDTLERAFNAAHWIRFVSNGTEGADRTFYLIGTQDI